MSKKTVTPKLRFPEFVESGEWEVKRLDELANVVASGDLNTENFSPTPSPQYIYPVYSNSVEQEGLYGYYSISKYPKNSITITARGTLGVAFTREQDFMGIGRLIVVSNLKDVNSKFLTECWNHLVIIPQEVTSIPQLTAITAKSIILPIPSLPEQQKIADCLTALDELLAAERARLEALKAYKKGLLQNLFPAEGESVPALRFPEFQSAGEWEEKPLGEIMPITSCKRVHKSEWASEGVPFYRAREIVALHNGEPISPLFISEELYKTNINLSGEIKAGDLLVTGVGSIGIPYLVKAGDRFYFKDGNIIWLQNSEEEITGKYLYLLYESEIIQKQIVRMAGVGTVGTYTIDNAKKTLAFFPKDLKEQQKIAACLSALDDEIASQSQRVAGLAVHKKGLLQGLFPSAGETSEV